jgi:hypothetical protein
MPDAPPPSELRAPAAAPSVAARGDGPRWSRPGFRFSRSDAFVLVAGAALTFALWPTLGSYALLVPVALGHFFLFCNVFRVRRGVELLWAGVFLANFAAWGLLGRFSWARVLLTQLPVTLAILVVEVRHPRYHGIFSRPRIDARP